MSSDQPKEHHDFSSNLKWFIEKIFIPVLLALIAGYFTLVAAKILPNPFSRPARSQTSDVDLGALQGVWTGSVANTTTGTASQPDSITIRFGDCALEKVCGILEIEKSDSDPCTGNIIFNSIDGNHLLFIMQNRALTCGPGRSEYLELLDQNTLLFVSSGGDGENRGELHRSQ